MKDSRKKPAKKNSPSSESKASISTATATVVAPGVGSRDALSDQKITANLTSNVPVSLPEETASKEYAETLAKGLPVVPLRDIILFPGTVTPILLGRPQSLAAMMRALESPSQLAFFCLQRTASEDDVIPDTLHSIGVVGRIANSLSLPNNLSKILVESLGLAKVSQWQSTPNLILATMEQIGRAHV